MSKLMNMCVWIRLHTIQDKGLTLLGAHLKRIVERKCPLMPVVLRLEDGDHFKQTKETWVKAQQEKDELAKARGEDKRGEVHSSWQAGQTHCVVATSVSPRSSVLFVLTNDMRRLLEQESTIRSQKHHPHWASCIDLRLR